MMEQTLETMRILSLPSGDTLCAQSAHVLNPLLEIQAKNTLYIAEDSAYVSVQAQSDGQPTHAADAASAPDEGERLFVPYFGIMRIVRHRSKNAARDTSAPAATNHGIGTELGSFHTNDAANLVDPFLLDLRDENWMSQTTDMTFLDAFLGNQYLVTLPQRMH